MSTTSKHKRRNHETEFEETHHAAHHAKHPKKRHRWKIRLAILFGALGAVVWLLPTIVAKTPAMPWAVRLATADLQGSVTVQSVSLSWFSPVVASGIAVQDAKNQPVVEAETVTGDRSLASLLLNRSNLGTFRLEKPKLAVVLRDGGSNVEDLLAKYLASTNQSSSRFDLNVEVVDGSVALTDQLLKKTWQIDKLQLAVNMSAQAGQPIIVKTSGTVPDPQHPGRFNVAMNVQSTDSLKGELSLDAEAVPLAMFDALVGRFAAKTHLAGRLTSKAEAHWGDKRSLRGDVTIERLDVATPALGKDRVQLARVHAACQATQQGNRLEIQPSTVDCELGTASVSGSLDFGGKDPAGSLAWALHQTYQANGRIDLARLAAMLPRTLHIRKQTQITSGQVQVAAASRPDQQGMVWQAQAEAANVAAMYDGRPIAWQQPILITLDARDTPQGPVVQALKCQSDFLKLHVAGTPSDMAASLTVDLKQLAGQLGQFVDLGGLGLAGTGWGQLNWKRNAQQDFDADVELQFRDFRLAWDKYQPWTEENMLLFLSAKGRTDLTLASRLNEATLRVQTAADRLDARLTKPVADLRQGGTWPIDVQAQGQLQSWPARLRTWVDLADGSLGGTYQLAAEGVGSKDAVTIGRAKLSVDQLHVAGFGVNVDEPKADLVLAGGWDQTKRRLTVEPATLTSSTLAVQANNIVFVMPDQGSPQLTGVMRYQGSLQRMQSWLADRSQPPSWRMVGQLNGTAQLQQASGTIDVQTDAEIANLLVLNSSGERFEEPRVLLAAHGTYEPKASSLRIERAALESDALGATAKGKINAGGPQSDVQITGEIRYDFDKLCRLLRPYLGPHVRFMGRGTAPVAVHGPLDLARAKAEAAIQWDAARLYGCQIGPAKVQITMADGLVRTQPLELAVSRGRLHLAPQVRLSPGPMELTMPAGPLADKIDIDPEMCSAGLQFIAPALAGVTTADGSFSLALDGCRIPLQDPAKGELGGKLTIHSVEVGPGPLVHELAVVLSREAPAKLRRESVVTFRMVEGRMYHQGLELVFPDLTVRTYGSVGLDETVAIMTEMPIPPKWIGNNPVGDALRNQTIRVPIGGTLTGPRLDRAELDRANRQLIQHTARNVIENEVGKGLERLLGPQR